ncbi:type I restriction endonuclease subunit R [Micromonospora chokoriensis]|uniref:Type I restriction enzyme endonuclease subunit n=1 Tax=Micromonospora chokoriensis TaxID=356851 RepID=A0A1C4UD65_9ACTN|nr:type I restriction endonuclease subunit R [Micromonospora chokoriensis]SCE69623.1 type I restriction enzyme, R subunit [Micromonospora chokoriensis]
MAQQAGGLTEAGWEQLAREWFAEWGWKPVEGVDLAPRTGERLGWDDLLLTRRLHRAVARINPDLPATAVEDAIDALRRPESQDALAENYRVHQLITRGVSGISYPDAAGITREPTVWLVDYADPYANEFLVASQVKVTSGDHARRLDLVCYVNGLPLAVVELKSASRGETSSATAYAQLRSYLRDLGPAVFAAPVVWVASDGATARIGTPFTPWEHMAPWNVDEHGRRVDVTDGSALEVMVSGAFEPARFLDLVANFISFSVDERGVLATKKLAKAHQFHAVNKAVERTLRATRTDGRAGYVWHTQGSGKSMEMVFYAAKAMRHPALDNPTIVVVTDRTDLDGQLFETFAASRLLPETQPKRVGSRDELRDQLRDRPTGGILFTTLQKFGLSGAERAAGRGHPRLSERRNIVVIVDEAHRSHYDFLDGYARHLRDALPHAAFIAFTGTPIRDMHKNTGAVFGTEIDTYDLTRAVDDGATVRVFYENRHIPVHLPANVDPDDLDDRAEDAVGDLSPEERRKAERAFAAISAVVGAPERVRQVAEDIVEHWERRSAEMRKVTGVPGKGMIVCLSRDICARLYDEIVTLRPAWGHAADDKGRLKVVFSGGRHDGERLAPHIRTATQNKVIQRRATDPDDDLELVIVQSMWLTGFDSPPLHTLYVDKFLRGAALMQAIARVNRRFGEKPAGLVVDYLGIADRLTEALAEYTVEDQEERPVGADVSEEGIPLVVERHGIVSALLAGYDFRAVRDAGGPRGYLDAILGAVEYLRAPARGDDGSGPPELSRRFTTHARELGRAFALAPAAPELRHLHRDIAFFEAVRLYLIRLDAEARAAQGLPSTADIELALRQLAASAVAADAVVDVYGVAGVEKPDLSHLDEAFIERIKNHPRPNLALEALRRAIERGIRQTHRHNLVRQRAFTDRLLDTMRRYTNGALTSAQVVEELVRFAQEVAADRGRAAVLGLTDDELAFYDAVAANESAMRELGSDTLAEIAHELVRRIRADVTVDWSVREQVQARIRSKVKRLLARYGYPPDEEPRAIELVLAQAKTFAEEWS